MTEKGQRVTKAVYEDPQVVAGYVESQSNNPPLAALVESFAQTLPRNGSVIDVGCGPGHDAYLFAEKGFNVVGVDYSSEMIKAAKGLKQAENVPDFKVGDMRQIGEMFPENSFDAAWVSASLLHVPHDEAPNVLQGIHKIVKDGGKVYIGLKAGERGEQVLSYTGYRKPIEREFVFWGEEFGAVAQQQGFRIEKEEIEQKGPTAWRNMFLEVQK